tara:strand:- start:154 stop:390 length:237 start_codon:yes stop_codon:yes gene_type:complete
MEYFLGPIIAAVISVAFSEKRCKDRCSKHEDEIANLEARVEAVANSVRISEQEMPKRLMSTLLPVAKEVTKLKSAVGI